MKRLVLFLVPLYFLAASFGFGQERMEIAVVRVFSDLAALQQLSPRAEGTKKESETLSYLKERLGQMEIPVTQFSYDRGLSGRIGNLHSFSSLLEATLEGTLPGEILFVVSISGPKRGQLEGDGSVNLALALGILETVRAEKGHLPTIRVLFLGAERGPQKLYPIGSRLYLEKMPPEVSAAIFYLDFATIPQTVVFWTTTQGEISPLWLVRGIAQSLKKQKLTYEMDVLEPLLYPLPVQRRHKNPASIYLKERYSALTLVGEGETSHPQLWVERFLRATVEFSRHYTPKRFGQWDRHFIYSSLEKGGFITSKIYLLILILIVFFLFFLIQFYTRSIMLRVRLLRPYFGIYLILIFITLFSFILSTLFIETLLILRKLSLLWSRAPLLFFFLKTSIFVFVFSLLTFLFKGLFLKCSSHFYSYVAALSSAIISVGSLFFNLTLSLYFIWNFILIFIFIIFKNHFFKNLSFLATVVTFILAIIAGIHSRTFDILGFLILSRFYGSFLWTVLVFPSVLLSFSLVCYQIHRQKSTEGIKGIIKGKNESLLFLLLVVVNVSGLLIMTGFYPKFTPDNPQRVLVNELINLSTKERTITMESEAPIGEVQLITENRRFHLKELKRKATIPLKIHRPFLKVQKKETTFFVQRNVRLFIQAEENLEVFELKLQAPQEITIYDSNYPYTLTSDRREVLVHVGKNPPLPLEIFLSLAKDQRIEATLSFFYGKSPYEFKLSRLGDETLTVRKGLRIIEKLSIGPPRPTFLNENGLEDRFSSRSAFSEGFCFHASRY